MQVCVSKVRYVSQGGDKAPSAQQGSHPLTSSVPSQIQH